MLLQPVQHATKGTELWPVNCVVCSKENLPDFPVAPKMWNHAGVWNQSSTRDPRDCPRERQRCLPKGSTWIGSDSQGKGVPGAKVLMSFQLHTKAAFDSSWPEASQKKKTAIDFLPAVKVVAELYWWKPGKVIMLQRGQQFWLLFHPKFWFQTQFSVATALSVDKKGLRASQWCQVNTEGHCYWTAAGLRLCPSSIISHHNPAVTLRTNLLTRNLPNNALKTLKCLSFTLLNNKGGKLFL